MKDKIDGGLKPYNTYTPSLMIAIEAFEQRLPGWWWSVTNCALTRDASCGPDARVIGMEHPHVLAFDDGFHCDGGGSVASSLYNVMIQAEAAIIKLTQKEYKK